MKRRPGKLGKGRAASGPPTLQSAVALQYGGSGAPRVTAKGGFEVAEAIYRRALDHGVPIHEDPDLVRLLCRLDLGDEIPRELYVAVAQVLAFAYWVAGKTPPAR